MKYRIITFGCQMNKSDSERIAQALEGTGYQPASRENEADLILVNMCSVRQSAVDRVYGLLPKFEKLKAKKPKLKTILTGCVLKKDRKKFTKVFDLILNIKDLPRTFFNKKILKELGLTPSKKVRGLPKLSQKIPCQKVRAYKERTKNYLKIRPKYQTHPLAFVPISNGCNNFCSYCVVPFTRGSLICRDHRDVLEEVKNLIKQGFKEIWLLGQNVNDYQAPSDSSINFAKLLKMLNNLPGDFSIRFISPNPKPSTRAKLGAGLVPHRPAESRAGAGNFSWNELIEVMASSKKVAKYLNLPVQSGDNGILKRMNRPYTVAQYKSLVRKIRKKIPDINLSTDVIVGFPGETKKQFENTVKLFKEIKFNIAYIAKYSPRPGTAAFQIKNNVPFGEKRRREKILRKILTKNA